MEVEREKLVKSVEEEFGRIDILVNNAAVAPPPVIIDQTTLHDWHRVIDVDLHGVFYCLKEGLAIMKEQGSGSIINISSVSGLRAAHPQTHPQAPYVAAKHAVIGLSKQAAAEYGPYGIRVNCIAPGLHVGTRLPESEGDISERTKEERKAGEQRVIAKIPLRRVGVTRDMRGLMIYLASDSSSFVTGELIVEDGGMSIY